MYRPVSLSIYEREYIVGGAESSIRSDGRKETDYRDFSIEVPADNIVHFLFLLSRSFIIQHVGIRETVGFASIPNYMWSHHAGSYLSNSRDTWIFMPNPGIQNI